VSQVPNLGDKLKLVGPVPPATTEFRLRADLNPYLTGDVTLASGTYITLGQAGQTITINYSGPTPPDPADTAPPEVQETSVLGVSARYARQDHTHQSPTIYWPQGAGPNDNVVANRDSAPTRTPAASGATNFCNYAPASALDGATGVDCTISGGRDNSALSLYDAIGGGYVNATLDSTDEQPANVICGGLTNNTLGFHHSSICGGSYNIINNPDDPTYEGFAACITGGSENEVYRSGGRSGGYQSSSYSVGEDSFACGSESGNHGESQDSRVVVAGSTPGSAPNESITLRQYIEPVPADNVVLMRADRCYVMQVRIVAADTASSSQAVWIYGVSARTDGAAALTINDTSVIYSHNDAGSASWTITISASGSELRVVFATGAGVTDAVKITAVIEYAQIVNT
jgi:hypothetical protein